MNWLTNSNVSGSEEKTMAFHFNAKKATQIAAVLLRYEDGKMEHLRLLKLLYIADRESLKETGRTISQSRATAMDHGPLSSDVYALLNGERIDERLWSQFIHKHGHNILLTDDPGRSELSKYEIAKLNEVSQRFEHLNTWRLADLTHEFEEWIKNKPHPGSSRPIPIGEIIDAIGLENKQSIIEEMRDKAAMDRLFADH